MTQPQDRDKICRLQPELLRLARYLSGQPELAQDLCQDVMLSLWVRLENGEDIRDLRAYAMTSLRNAYRQSRRHHHRGVEIEEDMLTTEPEAFVQLALQELDEAIARLPEPQRQLIRMVAEGETSPAALALRTGVPKGTVMSRLARARAQLRSDMGLGARASVSALI